MVHLIVMDEDPDLAKMNSDNTKRHTLITVIASVARVARASVAIRSFYTLSIVAAPSWTVS